MDRSVEQHELSVFGVKELRVGRTEPTEKPEERIPGFYAEFATSGTFDL
jgi:hypothetical protein